MKSRKYPGGLALALTLAASSAHATDTPKLTIEMVDAVDGNMTYVSLAGYTNTACENNRMLINTTDSDHYKQMVAMVLSAFHAGTPVIFRFDVSGDQCVVSRMFSYLE